MSSAPSPRRSICKTIIAMATAYTIIAPRPAGVPEPVVVRIVATRADGKALSR